MTDANVIGPINRKEIQTSSHFLKIKYVEINFERKLCVILNKLCTSFYRPKSELEHNLPSGQIQKSSSSAVGRGLKIHEIVCEHLTSQLFGSGGKFILEQS